MLQSLIFQKNHFVSNLRTLNSDNTCLWAENARPYNKSDVMMRVGNKNAIDVLMFDHKAS